MNLSPGTRVGPYEVVSAIGAGGMGEVYRARDVNLGRDVALKVLPKAFTDDPERLSRFEREARTLASLNHQNIAAIYGLERSDAGPVLVMEFVEGRGLDEMVSATARTSAVRMSTDDAIAVARQIAEALEAAHDNGIVHRDLKPANVKVRPDGTVKVLDFGLAKALAQDSGSGSQDPGLATRDPGPTMTSPAMTAQGMILGTASYMAPEQARGRQVDRRADIWAFGVVLYEMLAGRQLFGGDSVADVLAAVMTREPDLAQLPPDTPPAVRALIVRCLERDPKQRLQAIGEARIVLSDPNALRPGAPASDGAGPAARRSPVARVLTAAGVVAAIAVTALAAWSLGVRSGPATGGVVRKLDVAVEVLQATDQGAPVLSPDGTRIVYRAGGNLWVRNLASVDPVKLPASEESGYAAWSPDSRFVVYAKIDEGLWKSPADGGAPLKIGPAPSGLTGSGGLVWTKDGRIIVSGSPEAGLSVLPESGGMPEVLVPIDSAREADFHEISLLPDGVTPLYVTHYVAGENRIDTIEAFRDGERKVVFSVPGDELRFPAYAAGYLVFERRRLNPGIWAVPFSPDRLEAEGDMFQVAADAGWPSMAADGTLAFVRSADMRRDLVWIDRSGPAPIDDGMPGVTSIVALPERADSPRLSPDGRRAVFTMGADYDIWTAELDTGALSRLTADTKGFSPLWSPDGARIVFGGYRGGTSINVYAVRSDGTGEVSRITNTASFEEPLDLTHDGRRLFVSQYTPGAPAQITAIPVDGSAPAAPIFHTPFDENWGSLSPDDRWMAYESTDSGRAEISVRPVEPGAARVPVSTDGGRWPKWSPDGRTIFYRQGTSMMGAPVTIGPDKVIVGKPELVVNLPLDLGLTDTYDVSPETGRFLFIRRQGTQRITLVLNWPAEAKRLDSNR